MCSKSLYLFFFKSGAILTTLLCFMEDIKVEHILEGDYFPLTLGVTVRHPFTAGTKKNAGKDCLSL